MTKRTVPDLKKLFKQASEIAQQVPESMQEAAFNRAIDLLTGATKQDTVEENIPANNTRKKKTEKQSKSNIEDDSADDLISAIDSTQHPGVASANKVLGRALMVLKIALTDHGIDGLKPSEIAKILTEKFRVSTTSNAVNMALGKATGLVNRVSSGPGYRYSIMGPGEAYLAHPGEDGEVPRASKKIKSKKKSASKKTNTKKKTTSTKSKGKKTQQKGAIGPKAAVIGLIDSGYFSQNRTGPEVQSYIKNKRGFNFGTDQLRLAMLRLVREQKLDRDENAEGQYEYRKS